MEQRRGTERRHAAGVDDALQRNRHVGLARVERRVEVDGHGVAEGDVRREVRGHA